jgi:hypothetical protein
MTMECITGHGQPLETSKIERLQSKKYIRPGEMTTTLGAFEWFLFGVAAEMTLQVLRPSERASADGTRGLTGRRARLHATILARAVGFDGTVNVREVYGLC